MRVVIALDGDGEEIHEYEGEPLAVGTEVWIDDARGEPITTTRYVVDTLIYSIARPKTNPTWMMCKVCLVPVAEKRKIIPFW